MALDQDRHDASVRRDDTPPDGQIRVLPRPLDEGIALAISGEIDLASVPTLERELLGAVERHTLVVLDLHHTTFMDCAGLGVVVKAEQRLRRCGGRLVLMHPSAEVQRLLALTGMNGRLDVRDGAEPLR